MELSGSSSQAGGSKKASSVNLQKKATGDKETGLLLKDVNKARAIAVAGDSPPTSPKQQQSQQQSPVLPHQLQPHQPVPQSQQSLSSSGKIPYTHSSAPEQLSKSGVSTAQERSGTSPITDDGSMHKSQNHKKVVVSSLKSNHVVSEPNMKKMAVEAPIKRKITTSSTATANSAPPTATSPSPLTSLFIVTPTKINFGSVVIGSTYRHSLSVVNSGIDTGRYTVKHQNNQQVTIHYTPGPVAPGISVKLDVELRATQLGAIQDEIRIETETEIFRVPLIAKVVDVHEAASPSKNARLVYTKTSLVSNNSNSSQTAAQAGDGSNV